MKSVACTIGAGKTTKSNFSSPAPQSKLCPMPSPIVPGIRGVGPRSAKEPGRILLHAALRGASDARTGPERSQCSTCSLYLATTAHADFHLSYPCYCLLSMRISKMVVSLHEAIRAIQCNAFEHGRQLGKKPTSPQ